ncbi:MAG: SGNH/GDSL hydrolase family protein [Planctomycetota bacterium]
METTANAFLLVPSAFLCVLCALCVEKSGLVAEEQKSFPPPGPPQDEATLGVGIQRTMTLLATSTPQQRHAVRILFYGQSITEQEWWKQVSDGLRRRFPNADLQIENRAIGGHSSQILCRTAEHDLYPFYPDLLIFHVYGGNKEYEQIIANTRRRTTAEILMQKDHVTRWPPEQPDREKDKGMWWDALMNNQFLPEIAKKYGCALADIRTPWLAYLKTNNLEPKALLRDGVHLNDQGNFLLAALVQRQLVHRPELPSDSWRGLVRTYEIGKDVQWQDGSLALEFDGNRVDAIAANEATGAAAARVLLDGKKPAEFPELYALTRPSATQAGFWPAILQVSAQKPLLLEDWTARITESNDEGTQFKFDVSGSQTGPDGSGSSAENFVSNSGRTVIEKSDWRLNAVYQLTKKKVPAGFQIKWKAVPLFVDEYQPPKSDDPARESVTTLAQGLSNGKHRLELAGAVPIRAIRVYTPPVR